MTSSLMTERDDMIRLGGLADTIDDQLETLASILFHTDEQRRDCDHRAYGVMKVGGDAGDEVAAQERAAQEI